MLKGFGILLMVLGHMWFNHLNYETYIYAFHMPLFFVISGYLYKTPANLGASVKKKMRTLLVPYFFFGLLYYAIWMFRHYQPGGDWVTHLRGVLLISVDDVPYESALWFLMALFWAWLFFVLLERFIKDEWIRAVVIIVLSFIGSMWGKTMPFLLPWGWQNAMAILVYFWLGNTYRRHQGDFRFFESWRSQGQKRKVVFLIIGLLVNAVFIYQNKLTIIKDRSWGVVPATYFNAVVAVWLYAELAKILAKRKKFMATCGRVLAHIGQYSIVWVCINHMTIKLAKRGLALLNISFQHVLLKDIVVVLVTYVIIAVVAEVVMRTPLKIIVGKKLKVKDGLVKS